MPMQIIRQIDAVWYALKDERGTTQIEYGLIAVLVAIVAILLLMAIAFDVQELFNAVEGETGNPADGGEVPVPVIGDDDAP